MGDFSQSSKNHFEMSVLMEVFIRMDTDSTTNRSGGRGMRTAASPKKGSMGKGGGFLPYSQSSLSSNRNLYNY